MVLKVISAELQFFFKTKRQIDTCVDHTRPSLVRYVSHL